MIANILRMGGTLPEPLKEAEEYHSELSAMRPEDLQALYEQEHEKERIEQQVAADREEAQRFFNQPRAEADFEYWSKCAYWTLDEAIALSLGKAPQIVSWEQVKGYAGIMSFLPIAEMAAYHLSLFNTKTGRELALRAARRKLLSDPVLPWKFLAWASASASSIRPSWRNR